VYLSASGFVKLGDMGLGRMLNDYHEKAMSIVGTPYYMSPEVVQGRPYEYKSDMWSFGCLIYELAMLQPPFAMVR